MRRLRLLGIAAFLAACFGARGVPTTYPRPTDPPAGGAQETPLAIFRMGAVEEPIRTVLRKAWQSTPGAHERAYCATWHVEYWKRDSVFIVDGVTDAKTGTTTPTHVYDLDCPTGTAPVHTHPPATCYRDTSCTAGGYGAFQCFPSTQDIRFFELGLRRWPFGVVQCGPDHFVFFQPILVLLRQAADGTTVKP